MSVYDDHPRVARYDGDIFMLTLDGLPGFPGKHDARVQPAASGGGFEVIVWGWDPVRSEFATADEAIASLIGPPR